MSDKKHELLLIAGALVILAAVFIFGVFTSPRYSHLEPASYAEQTTAPSHTQQSTDTIMVDLNTDSIDELMTLDGIGEAKSRAIIEYRRQNGDFRSVAELLNVEGIGQTIYEKNLCRLYI